MLRSTTWLLAVGVALAAGAGPRTTARTFFWPGVPAFDGSYLWVGEFKFSGRLLRFSVGLDGG